MRLNLKKMAQFFQFSVHVYHLPSVATDRDRKQFQCLNVVLHNKPGPLFLELNGCGDHISFLKRSYLANSSA